MCRSAGSGARGARDVARGGIAGGGGKLFGFRRGGDQPAPAYLREKCANSGRRRRRARGLRAGHAADGALHEELSAAGICHAPVWIAGCGCSDEEIGGSGIYESGAGAVEIAATEVAENVARRISIQAERGKHERKQRAISICFGTR